MFRTLTRWLRGKPMPAPIESKEPALAQTGDLATASEESHSHPVAYDENLLERSRTQWQFGDWASLAKLERSTLQHHPDRAKLALMAAAGRLQTGQPFEARHFVQLAQEWGVSKKLVAQVLVAGTYNSLGKAAVIAGQKQRGLEYFKASVAMGIPTGDIRLLSQARAEQESAQLGLNWPFTYASENRPLGTHQAQQTLAQLYELHQGKVSDKWTSYLDEYDQAFAKYRNSPVRILEVGIQNGGSLEIWAKYFPDARQIIGCDINPKCAELEYEDRKISVIVGDINTDNVEREIRKHTPEFDIIIDDGSHHSGDIVKTFARYYPLLEDGGLYIVEDLHCSYWQKWEGGLFSPDSSMAFFKQLSDIVNHEHWGIPNTCEDAIKIILDAHHFCIDEGTLKSIHSIMFCNSLCIIRKESPQHNNLGERLVAGTIAKINSEVLGLHKSSSPKRDESNNPWSKRC